MLGDSSTRQTAFTYVPFLNRFLAGDHSEGQFKGRGVAQSYDNVTVATAYQTAQIPRLHTASGRTNNTEDKYNRENYDIVQNNLAYEFTAAIKKQLYLEAQAKTAAVSGFNIPRVNPYFASVPPGGGDAASAVTAPITQIPFMRDIIGRPTQKYFINALTKKTALPQLHAELPETDFGVALLQLEPTQLEENLKPTFAHHFFHARRNAYPFSIPREYRMRATLEPYDLYTSQANDALKRGREALTLLALSGLPDQNGEGFEISKEDLPDPSEDTSNGTFPAAKNNSKAFYVNLFAEYFVKSGVEIDSVVMNPVDFVKYESNFFTMGFRGADNASDWGLVQLPGFKQNIRVAMSPYCPQNQQYFFNSEYVFTGEGPQVTETWAKPEANSDSVSHRDYVDIRIFNATRAGFKAKIAGTTPTEVTTIEQARAMFQAPDNLLETNSLA